MTDGIHRRSHGEPTEEESVTRTTTEAGRYAGLVNQRGSISRSVYDLRHGRPASINVLGRAITSFAAPRRSSGLVELDGSQARL
ncbi:hypothetical protein ABT144_20910 [Streptomyces sp. NPDC002039]|uniref:hypothetical protein n=1 Tax=unclassified Streptomyces TaxID=2593676 RepID=UPI0033326C35